MGNNLISLLFIAATSLPTEEVKIIIIQNDLFEISISSADMEGQFVQVEYIEEEGNLQMVTKDNIHSILIYQDEEIVFMLPVMSDKVTLGKSLFDEGGVYQLGFKFEDASELAFADMVMN